MVNPEYSRDAPGNKIQRERERERGIALDLVPSMTDDVATTVSKENYWHCFSSTAFIAGCGYGN
jgi:hypothetical protein